ncbi:MAG: Salicylate hydroxylase [Modestobacter sp.]|jgi:hypothetical protein|nr:Salicylate hydroxylase [Modestobacter sp.]
MAIEDAGALSAHVGAQLAAGHPEGDATLAAQPVRRRAGGTGRRAARARGARRRLRRLLHGPTALTPDQEPPTFTPQPLELPADA